VTVTDEYALINGLRLHYRDWRGPQPDAPLLLLLHGFTSHARTWDPFAPAFATAYRVLALDARGHGESEWAPPGSYTAAEQASDVVKLVDALGYERASLVGSSMGGRSAYNCAIARPDLVDRLVVVDISPTVAAAGSARIRGGVERNDRFGSVEEAVESLTMLLQGSPPAAVRARAESNLLLCEDGSLTWRYDAALRQPAGLPRPDGDDQWARLGRITARTLLLRGGNSDVLAPEDARRFVETVPDARLVEIPDSGHSITVDQPARFLAAVAPFLLE
jgi:pimeloyl-ACP methyl ester carboxylesterase